MVQLAPMIDQTGQAMSISILITPHLWPIWAGIAIDEERSAHAARAEILAIAQLPGQQGLGDALSKELRPSLVSIAAASHCLDALYGVLAAMVIDKKTRDAWKRKREAGDPVGYRKVIEALNRAVTLDNQTRKRWRGELKWLFGWRNFAVHYREEASAPVPHPSSTTNSSDIYVHYSAETATRAVNLVLEILDRATTVPRNKPGVIKWASDFRGTVEDLEKRRRT